MQFTLHDEFEISDAATASAGLKQLRSEMVDLVLLDVRLPDMDGREACKQMRKSGYRGPIIMLTAQDTEADTILGLDLGANDYIAKPFRFGVLLARIRAQLGQFMEPDDTPPDDDDDDDLPPPDRAGLRMTTLNQTGIEHRQDCESSEQVELKYANHSYLGSYQLGGMRNERDGLGFRPTRLFSAIEKWSAPLGASVNPFWAITHSPETLRGHWREVDWVMSSQSFDIDLKI